MYPLQFKSIFDIMMLITNMVLYILLTFGILNSVITVTLLSAYIVRKFLTPLWKFHIIFPFFHVICCYAIITFTHDFFFLAQCAVTQLMQSISTNIYSYFLCTKKHLISDSSFFYLFYK